MIQYCVDVETLDNKSTAVVLSLAICWFDGSSDVTYEEYVERTLYVKLDMKEQLQAGRTKSKATIEWWQKQGTEIQKLCLFPSPNDVDAVSALGKVRDYIKNTGGTDKSFIWARGSLDQSSLDSLAETFGVEPIAAYNQWMDVRTAIRMTKETSQWSGYCDVPGFDYSKLSKHNPIDDIIIDILMLSNGV